MPTASVLAGLALDATLQALLAKLPTVGPTVSANAQPVVPATDSVFEISHKNTVVTSSLDQAAGSFMKVQVGEAQTLMFQFRTGGSGGGVITFEATIDNINWVPLPGKVLQTIAPTIVLNTGTLLSLTNYIYEFGVIGYVAWRARVTTAIATGLPSVVYSLNGATGNNMQVVQMVNTPTVYATGALNATPQPPSSTGTPITSYVNPALSALTLMAAGSHRITGFRIYNPNTTMAFVQLFNSATTGAVTLGTTAPLEVIPIEPSKVYSVMEDFSASYSSGVVLAATTTASGNTALATPLVVGKIAYI